MSKVKIGFAVFILAALLVGMSTSVKEVLKPEPVMEVMSVSFVTATPAPTAEPSPSVPATVIYNVPLSQELQCFTEDMCKKYSVDKYYPLMIAVMWQESTFDASEISRTHDYGLMQINRINHDWLSKELGLTNIMDPKQNIQAGVYMLAEYLLKYDNVNKALMAYNLGENGAKSRWKKGDYDTDYTQAVRDKLELVLTGETTETK